MSGFDKSWLDLREPADVAARAPKLLRLFAESLRDFDAPRIVDLGSGTGSTLRAVGPTLPSARWRLTDHDPALLAEAKRRHPEAITEQIDLAADLEKALAPETEAVTASALIDLVSASWIDRLVTSARGRVLYIALSYNGEESWSPECDFDIEIFTAFKLHQRGDKGFGPSLGPAAATHLARALEAVGYTLIIADSPWQIGSGDLMHKLAEGIASAALESGVNAPLVSRWLAERKTALRCSVGHTDLLAMPR